MRRKFTITLLTCLAVIALISTVLATPPVAMPNRELTQISGIGYYAAPDECNHPEGQGSDYDLTMTGSFEGCHYVFVEVSRCSPGGAYYESGTETFVGTYHGGTGTFRTNYVFTATYKDCPTFTGEIAGRCQHPIAAGSGTGVFEGVSGRFDMKDNVVTGDFPYRGHLSF